MITIHPRFRSEAEALDATRAALEASRSIVSAEGNVAWRVALLAHELTTNEALHGYAGPYKAAPCARTCTCAVCTWRREHREAGET